MSFFLRKSYVVEARPVEDDPATWASLAAWCGGFVVSGGVLIRTPEGDMLASPKDHVIKGKHGEFYPCKPDPFAYSYVAVPDGEI